MKRINDLNINTPEFWDTHIAEPDFGLRQQKYLELAGRGYDILDVGCGVSPFLNEARKNFKYTYGLDFSKKAIEKAEQKFNIQDKLDRIDYRVGDVGENYPFTLCVCGVPQEFDVVVAGEIIEHQEYPKDFILHLVRHARRRVILSTARMEYNDPEHLWEFTKDDLEKMGEHYGKTNVEEIKSERFPGRSYLFMTIDL